MRYKDGIWSIETPGVQEGHGVIIRLDEGNHVASVSAALGGKLTSVAVRGPELRRTLQAVLGWPLGSTL